MRVAALIFGFLAGVSGIAVVALGGLAPALAGNALLGASPDLTAQVALLALPALCFFGAGLAIGAPRTSGLFLLLAAIGWAAVAWLAGHGAIFPVALPFTFAIAGGIVALFGRRAPEDTPIQSASAAEATPAPARRARGYVPPTEPRNEPDFGLSAARAAVQLTAAPIPADDIIAEALASAEAPVVVPGSAPVVSAEPAAPLPNRIDLVPAIAPTASISSELPPLAPRLPAQSHRVEELAPEPPPLPPSAPEPGQAPLPEPLPQLPAEPERLAPTEPLPEPVRHELHPRAEELPADEDRERRRERLRRAVRLLIAVIFVLIVVGIVAAVMMNSNRRAQAALFGEVQGATTGTMKPTLTAVPLPVTPLPRLHRPAKPPAEAAPQAAPAPTPTAPEAATPAPAAPASPAVPAPVAAPATPPPVAPAPAAQPEAVAPPPAAPSPPQASPVPPPAANPAPATAPEPPATASAAPTTSTAFTNPVAYCAAIGTIDEPDGRFAGPPIPPIIGRALQQAHGGVLGPIHWRCEDGEIRACDSIGGASCEVTPTVPQMIAYCKAHPGTKYIPAPHGSWSCTGKKPTIPKNQNWIVDARGFYPNAWITLEVASSPPAN